MRHTRLLVFIISLISNVISERYGEGWLWGLVLLFFSCFVRLLYGSRAKPQNNRSVLLFIGNSPETHSRAQLRYSRFSNDRPRFYTATVLVSNYFFSSLNSPPSCKQLLCVSAKKPLELSGMITSGDLYISHSVPSTTGKLLFNSV